MYRGSEELRASGERMGRGELLWTLQGETTTATTRLRQEERRE